MKSILVIDDERDVLEIVRAVLKTKGYTIRCAEGGEEGLRQAQREKPDLILCDLMMPRVSGLEVIKRLKADERLRNVPVIVLSAVAADSDRPETYWAKGLGVDEYVTKPFDPLDLLGRVEYLLRRQAYVSSKIDDPTVANEGAAAVSPRTPTGKKIIDLTDMTPSEVAKTFAESWNGRQWDVEYQCMSDELTSAITLNDYIARRNAAFAEDGGQPTSRKLSKILEEKTSGNVAKVVAEREDITNGRAWFKKATYTLKKTFKGWKILKYSDEPLPRRPETVEED